MKFDTIYHLAGEQILPNYIGLKQFECKNHVIIVSEKTRHIANRLKEQVKDLNISNIEIDAYDIPKAYNKVFSKISNTENIAFNLTGGTKPMFIAAFLVCQNVKATPFYIETTGNTLDFMNEKHKFEKRKLIPVFDSVDTFINLAGCNIIDSGKWEDNCLREDRKELSQKCWENKRLLMDNKKVQKKIHENNLTNQFPKLFEIENKSLKILIEKNGYSCITFDDIQYETTNLFFDYKEALEYYGGGWFEEYCFLKIKPLLDSGKIKDLRIGLKPDFGQKQNNTKKQKVKQEFDISFTDGLNFIIIECKAGAVIQAHIQKIENIAYEFGGTFGKGILCSSFMTYGNVPKRIASSRNTSGFFNRGIEKLGTRVISVKPKQIIN